MPPQMLPLGHLQTCTAHSQQVQQSAVTHWGLNLTFHIHTRKGKTLVQHTASVQHTHESAPTHAHMHAPTHAHTRTARMSATILSLGSGASASRPTWAPTNSASARKSRPPAPTKGHADDADLRHPFGKVTM